MRLSVVIPSRNRTASLATTLPPLLREIESFGDAEAVLVDDASDEDYPARLGALLDRTRYVRLPRNEGAARARNRGAEEARGEILVFLDDDIEVGSGFLARHADRHRALDAPRIVTGLQVLPEATFRGSFGRYRIWKDRQYQSPPGEPESARPITGLTSANCSLPRASFVALGGFATGVRDLACQDYEFAWRAREAGYTILFDPAIRTLHHDSSRTVSTYLRRQHAFGYSHVRLRALNPTIDRDPMLAEELRRRGPIERGQPAGIVLRKIAFRALAARPVSAALEAAAKGCDAVGLLDRLAFPLYELAVEASYQRGYDAAVRAFAPRKAG